MKKHITNLFFLLIAFAGVAQQDFRPMQDKAIFREQVQEASGNIQSIQSKFRQEKHLAVLANPAKSAGNFYYSNNGFIRWEYHTPAQQSIIVDENNVVIINEGQQEKTNARTAKAYQQMNTLIADVIHGNAFGNNRFEYDFYESENFAGLVVMKPKESALAAHLESVELYFNSDHLVSRLQLNEPGGDFTRYEFFDQTYNQDLPEAVFTPEPMQ